MYCRQLHPFNGQEADKGFMSNQQKTSQGITPPEWTKPGPDIKMLFKKTYKPVGPAEIDRLVAAGHDEDNLPDKVQVVWLPVDTTGKTNTKTIQYYQSKGLKLVDPGADTKLASLLEEAEEKGRKAAMAELGENMPEPKTCPECEQAFFAKLPQQIYCDPCRTIRKARKGAQPKAEPVAVAE